MKLRPYHEINRLDLDFFVNSDDEKLCTQRVRTREWRDILLFGRDAFIRKGEARRLRGRVIFPGIVEVTIAPLAESQEPTRG